MKKFIKSILLFIPFTIVVYLIFLIIEVEFVPSMFHKNINFRIGSNGHLFTRIQELKKTNDVDIVFLGSSHTYRGFDPRIFKEAGFKTFNMGSSAQTPIQTEFLLRKYLDSLKPKLIIYEVYPTTFSIDGIESSTDIMSNEYVSEEMLDMVINENHIKLYNTFIISAYKEIFGFKQKFKEDKKKGDDTYIQGGFVERKYKPYKLKLHYPAQEWEFLDDQIEAFKRNLTLIKSKNIDIVLVQAPITSMLYNSYTNRNTFDEIMKKQGEYYNMNKIVSLDPSLHFFDSNHLNQNGVKIFNEKLIKIIKNRGLNVN